jgi:DNA replicative helicase MCM subunit Mcm2 (Cdc46/Mcm family)
LNEVPIEDTGARTKVQFILFPCRRCGALAVAPSDQKAKQCPSCNLSNKLAKVVVIKRFDDKETAVNALRLVKIPKAERDGVPYIAGSAMEAEKRTTVEDIMVFFYTIKRLYPDGIAESEMLERAKKEGLETKKVEKLVKKYKEEGALLETGHQTLRFA